VASAAPPAVVADCRSVSDKAMSTDLAAVTAQSKNADLAEQAKLFTAAVAQWTLVVRQCEGRAQERAVRNRDDDQQVLDRINEKLGAGPQCASGHKDASALQNMAKQALSDRRWADAASLFRKAENMWDFAAERCSGSQQEIANQRREQSVQDGHNAQFCAPLFEKAREQTQKLRSSGATMSREDKQDASMVVETLWRDALDNCKGQAVQDIALNNAKALAKERGTPWVPRLAPDTQLAGAPAAADGGATPALGAAKPSFATAALASVKSALTPSAAPLPAMTATAPVAASAVAVAMAAPTLAKAADAGQSAMPASPPAAAAPQVPGSMVAGTTRFVGSFARDADATSVSGTGKVSWANGDVFEGTLVRGLRHGQGTIVWANGQRYSGDWVQDKPTGRAKINFANGNVYEGQVLNGMPQGAGQMLYASGDKFDGQFKNGEPDERGVYEWQNGQRYDGAWVNGRPSGQGKLKFATGNQFEGSVVDGVPQGQGRMVFAAGEIYVGQFHEGSPDGQGSFTWPTGDQYSGEWKAGKKHGKGAFTWKSGDRWEGIYENDVQKN
jgi:hypothetical protein